MKLRKLFMMFLIATLPLSFVGCAYFDAGGLTDKGQELVDKWRAKLETLPDDIGIPDIPGIPGKTREIDTVVQLYKDSARDHKASAIYTHENGEITVAGYDNDSREDAWLIRIDKDGARQIGEKTSAETYGYSSVASDGWYYLPAEHKNAKVRRLNYKTGELQTTSYTQPAEYGARTYGDFCSYIPRGGGQINTLHNVKEGSNTGIVFDKLNGIVSGLTPYDGQWIASVIDYGIQSTAGWHISDGCPEVAVIDGKLIACFRDGRVAIVDNGEIRKVLGTTGQKPQRMAVVGDRGYLITSNMDELWEVTTSGINKIYTWGTDNDPITSGSLFDCSVAPFKDGSLAVSRSITDGGFEVYLVTFKETKTEEPAAPEGIVDVSSANPLVEWWSKSSEMAGDWPVVGTTQILRSDSSTFEMTTDPKPYGGNLVAYIGVWRENHWIVGGFEGMGEDFDTKTKTWKAANDWGIIGRYGRYDEQTNRDLVRVKNGDTVLLGLMSVDAQHRWSPAMIRYPDGSPAEHPTISSPTPEPDPTPVEPDPAPVIEVPERIGSPSFTGNGAFNNLLDLGRSNENPSKSVSFSCWFKVNEWSGGNSEQDLGAMLINKGLIGSHWSFAISAHPNSIRFGATRDRVQGLTTIKKGEWYYLSVIASPSTVDFWVNGQKLTSTGRETGQGSLFQSGDQPIRIGGYYVPWPNASWFNQSINGTIEDWTLEIR